MRVFIAKEKPSWRNLSTSAWSRRTWRRRCASIACSAWTSRKARRSEDHVEAQLTGFRVAWDTEALIKSIDPDWEQPFGQRIGIGFLCESPAEVDALYQHVTEAGYEGYKAPWDAFWGQRYAVVTDPDGSHVDLFAWV